MDLTISDKKLHVNLVRATVLCRLTYAVPIRDRRTVTSRGDFDQPGRLWWVAMQLETVPPWERHSTDCTRPIMSLVSSRMQNADRVEQPAIVSALVTAVGGAG